MSEDSQEIVILVVDDDFQVTTFIRRALEPDLTHSILVAGNGNEAWKIADNLPALEVLIVEVDLVGGMSGIELCKRVRQRHPSVKVLFVSGGGISQVAACPASPVLRKPFSAEELSALVREAAGGKDGTAKNETGNAAA